VQEMRSPQQSKTLPRSKEQIEGFREACELGREILDEAHRAIKPGVTTDEIDRVSFMPHKVYPH
jgi:methionyl aminopeptidase